MLPSMSSLLLRKVPRIEAYGLSTSIKNTSEHCKAMRISKMMPAPNTITVSPINGAESVNSNRAKVSNTLHGKTAGIIYKTKSR